MKKILTLSIILLIFIAGYFSAKYETYVSESLVSNTEIASPGQHASGPEEKTGNLKANKNNAISQWPLPPANTPLAEVFDLLKQRADAGDGKAACRLSIELMRCRQAKNMSKYMLSSTDDSYLYDQKDSLKQKLLIQNGQDEQRLKLLEKNMNCKNITDEQYKLVFKYLRQAAYAEEPDALVPYIDGMGLTGFSAIRGREFDVWRTDAVPLAESALRRGLPETVRLLGNGYSDDNDFFSALVDDDPFQAEVMGQLYLRLFELDSPGIKNDLSIEQNTQAQIQSEKMFQDYFHGQISARSSSIKRQSAILSIETNLKAPCE